MNRKELEKEILASIIKGSLRRNAIEVTICSLHKDDSSFKSEKSLNMTVGFILSKLVKNGDISRIKDYSGKYVYYITSNQKQVNKIRSKYSQVLNSEKYQKLNEKYSHRKAIEKIDAKIEKLMQKRQELVKDIFEYWY